MKNKIVYIKNRYPIYVVMLFLISFVLRSICALYSGVINIIFDELIYWDISKSIFNSSEILVRGIATSNKEILYPLILSIAHFFQDRETVYTVMLLINCALMSSVVFPVYLLAKKLLYSKKVSIYISLGSILLPEMFYTTRLLQENLYYPMFMWVLCLFVYNIADDESKILNTRSFLKTGSFAFSICLLTYIKQIGLCVLVGALVYYIFMLFGKSGKKYKIRVCVNILTCTGFFFLGKVVLNKIIEMIFNQSVESESNQLVMTALENLLNLKMWQQYIFPILFYIIWILLAWGVFTILIPLYTIKKLDRTARSSIVFIMGTMAATLGVICLLILGADNEVGKTYIRFHLRYLFYFFIPLFIIFLKSYTLINKNKKLYIITISLIIYSILIIFCPLAIAQGSEIDAISSNFFKIFFLTPNREIIFKILIVLCILISFYLIIKQKIFALYFCVIVALSVSFVYSSVKAYRISSEEKEILSAVKEDGNTMNEYFNKYNISSDDILIVAQNKASTGVLEVYLDFPYRVCSVYDFNEQFFDNENIYMTYYSVDEYQLEKIAMPEFLIVEGEVSNPNYKKINVDLKNYILYGNISKKN